MECRNIVRGSLQCVKLPCGWELESWVRVECTVTSISSGAIGKTAPDEKLSGSCERVVKSEQILSRNLNIVSPHHPVIPNEVGNLVFFSAAERTQKVFDILLIVD